MNMDDRHPAATPTIRGSINSLMEADVIINIGTITIRVVKVVIMDLDKV